MKVTLRRHKDDSDMIEMLKKITYSLPRTTKQHTLLIAVFHQDVLLGDSLYDVLQDCDFINANITAAEQEE